MKRWIVTPASQTDAIKAAVTVLQEGGLVLFPTETTYGAGVDTCNPDALKKLLAYKSRREGKPMSIAVTDLAMAQQYVDVNEQALTLYRQFLPGPVTVISKSLGRVAAGVESEFGTLGVRIPNYSLVLELVKTLGRPITATSANASGEKRPYSVEDVLTRLSGKQLALIDLILDVGQLPIRPPSTVIDTTLSTPITVRQGEVQLPHTVDDQLVTTGTEFEAHSSDGTNKLPITSTVTSTQLPSRLNLLSRSEAETKRIAGQLLLQQWDELQKGPIIIALDGPLGAGKTVFAKGVAEFLGITEPITSPTYTYIEEYDFSRHQTKGKLYHLDMWKVDSQEQFERLEFASMLKPQTVVIVEWWGQVRSFAEPLLSSNSTRILQIKIEDVPTSSVQRKLDIILPDSIA